MMRNVEIIEQMLGGWVRMRGMIGMDGLVVYSSWLVGSFSTDCYSEPQ